MHDEHVAATPPIWIISLERAFERRTRVAAAFDDLNLPFELMDAIDGNELTPEQIARYSNWRALFGMGRPMAKGMFGCSLSHLAAWERMVDEGVPVVAIFEDDVEPSPALAEVLESLDRLPADWDVVTLHSLFESAGPQPIDALAIAGDHQICTYRRTPMGAQGYLLRIEAARRLCSVATPIAYPPDELLFRARPAKLIRYGVEPSVLVHRETASELVGRPQLVVPSHRWRRPGDWLVRIAGKVQFRVLRRVDRWTARRRTRQNPS
jgi:glycosyl transferase family 25